MPSTATVESRAAWNRLYVRLRLYERQPELARALDALVDAS